MPRGFVVIKVKEASGKNRNGNVVWDPNFIEGFIRAEMRTDGGQKIVENSTTKRVIDNKMSWEEELRLEVKDNSRELRLMLCKEKRAGTRTGTSCVAACGIFVADILRAVPINKYFELYKPKATDQSEGGFIKVVIEFEDHSIRSRGTSGTKDTTSSAVPPRTFATEVSGNLDKAGPRPSGKPPAGIENEAPALHAVPGAPEGKHSRSNSVLKATFLIAALGAGAFVCAMQLTSKKDSDAKLTKKESSDRK